MATLREVTSIFRHIFTIGLLSIAGIFVIFWTINYIRILHPAPPPPPTVSFGKLPKINFPLSVTDVQLKFNLDTLSGNLPSFPDRATIYKMQQNQPTLLALDSAKTIVEKMGYFNNPVKISEENYQWTNSDDLPKTLLLNIITNDFTITSNYLSNNDVLQGNNLPDQNTAINTVTDFLYNSSLLPTDIDTNKTKATLLKITNGQLYPATSLSNTQVIQVDLFQSNVANLTIFYPQPTHSTMSLYVAGGSNSPQIIMANFNHQSISQEKATYPIITIQQALDKLKNQEGYISSFDRTVTNVTIRNIVLGYYISDKKQQYLLPIYVFEGDHDFFAYVPAVKDDWIK